MYRAFRFNRVYRVYRLIGFTGAYSVYGGSGWRWEVAVWRSPTSAH